MAPVVLAYRTYQPTLAGPPQWGSKAAVIGRTRIADGVVLEPLVVLRGDGEWIRVGSHSWFGSRATVHIADAEQGTDVGNRVTVGRYALVHACTVGDGVVIGDAAVVMDRSVVGDGAVIAAGALVPPGKALEGGWLHSGSPARPVRVLEPGEADRIAEALRRGEPSEATATIADPLPPLGDAPFRPESSGGPMFSGAGIAPAVSAGAYVAPTAAVWGDVRIETGASVWFSAALRAGGGRIEIGKRSNIQDNTIIDITQAGMVAEIGDDVTVGHNVRLDACRVGDRCLIGMGATVSAGAVVEDDAFVGARAWVEPGTTVRAGWIWAGRPARAFREVRPQERDYFRRGKEAYEDYASEYLAGSACA